MRFLSIYIINYERIILFDETYHTMLARRSEQTSKLSPFIHRKVVSTLVADSNRSKHTFSTAVLSSGATIPFNRINPLKQRHIDNYYVLWFIESTIQQRRTSSCSSPESSISRRKTALPSRYPVRWEETWHSGG
jgi:hypothetical protein